MPVKQLDRLEAFLERLYRREITENWDRVILVIGDEGVGKSTFMLQCTWLWEQVRGNDPTPDSVLSSVVWGSRDEFQSKVVDAEVGDMITVQDAARILMKKESMNPDQVEVQKGFLDLRIENHVIVLGYQDWDDAATFLQRRRAETVFRIPHRGIVEGYNRSSIDERFEGDEWPEPDFRDQFPSLDGTDLWERFEEIDAQKKRERLQSETAEDDGVQPQDVVDEILSDGVEEYVEENEYNGRCYISKPLIKYDYPELSDQEADQVKHALKREGDVDLSDESDTDGEGGTPHA